MALFTIWRELDPDAPPGDNEANIPRAITASVHFRAVRWLRTYALDVPGRVAGFCVYEAPQADDLFQHHAYCRVPYVEIREVDEELGASLLSPAPEVHYSGRLFLDEDVGPDSRRPPGTDGEVLRSYLDRERGHRSRIIGGHAPPGSIPITMVHPSEWAEIYDNLGLPRHWDA